MSYYWRNVDHYKPKVNAFLGNEKERDKGTWDVGLFSGVVPRPLWL